MKRVINGKTYSKVLGIKQGSLLTAGKDGDIEEYKADPTDAGKVLTVGEDGGVAPAAGGDKKIYRHCIKVIQSGYGVNVYLTAISSNSEAITTGDALRSLMLEITNDTQEIPISATGEVANAYNSGTVNFITVRNTNLATYNSESKSLEAVSFSSITVSDVVSEI